MINIIRAFVVLWQLNLFQSRYLLYSGPQNLIKVIDAHRTSLKVIAAYRTSLKVIAARISTFVCLAYAKHVQHRAAMPCHATRMTSCSNDRASLLLIYSYERVCMVASLCSVTERINGAAKPCRAAMGLVMPI